MLIRLLKLLLMFAGFFARGSLIKIRFFRNPKERDSRLRLSVVKSAKRFLEIFGIQVQAHGFESWRGRPRVLVSNHLSYIDIVVLLSQDAFAFLTSREVYRDLLLGPFIRFSGSSYVDRRSPIRLRSEFARLNRLAAETPIVLFPEATTSNGEKVLPFKRALLEWARREGIWVQTCCIRYVEWNEEGLDRAKADRIYYYGEMNFFSHLWSFLKTKQALVVLEAKDEAFKPENFETSEEWNRSIYEWVSRRYQQGVAYLA